MGPLACGGPGMLAWPILMSIYGLQVVHVRLEERRERRI
jgi:hypothetical protein